MSTPELERAIAAARWQGAEASVSEAIGKILDVDPAIVERVVFAWTEMKDGAGNFGERAWLVDQCVSLQEGVDLPPDVASAIDRAVTYAIRRMAIRHCMERNQPIRVPFSKLVPAGTPSRICNGCLWQLECVRDFLSTPQSCLAGKVVLPRNHGPDDQRKAQHVHATVRPVKLATVTVSVVAEHPRGAFEIDLMDVVI